MPMLLSIKLLIICFYSFCAWFRWRGGEWMVLWRWRYSWWWYYYHKFFNWIDCFLCCFLSINQHLCLLLGAEENPEWHFSENLANPIGFANGDHDLAHSVLQVYCGEYSYMCMSYKVRLINPSRFWPCWSTDFCRCSSSLVIL